MDTSTTSKASKGQQWKFELCDTSATSKAKWCNFELLAESLFWHPKYDHWEVVKTICWANETFLQSSQLFNPTLKYFFYLEKWYFYYFEESLTDTSYTSFNWILQTYEILQQNEVNSVPFQLEA